MGSKVELENFDGNGDFSLWKQKMKAILVQQRISKALEDPEGYLEALKAKPDSILEMNEIAYSSIFLHLTDNVLRQVSEQKTAVELWKRLNDLFMIKTLPNKVYLLEKLFSFKMDPSKDLDVNLDDFNKLVQNLSNVDKKFDDEDLFVILLNSLPDHFKDVKNVIKYGRDDLSITLIVDALRSRELEFKQDVRSSNKEENLFVRRRSEKRDNQNYNSKDKSGTEKDVSMSDLENEKIQIEVKSLETITPESNPIPDEDHLNSNDHDPVLDSENITSNLPNITEFDESDSEEEIDNTNL
ncbi:Uncharacterized protein Adt_24244 [Abeliophyllum distichum]|uniref:Retrovirus-related Pol polyprotein from transposon TNT 1-94 n=1 Tax=Abeliophyllum distichum TaxID=126358 RepID=A0ABD1SD77_9LAMI